MLHSLWEFRNGRHTFRMGIARLIGVDKTLGDPNSFGASIVFALPFVRLFWLTAQKRLLKFFLAAYTGLSSLCILLTGSRSSLLGLLFWLALVCLFSRRRMTFLALGTVLACGAFAALPDYLQTRFETIINPDVGPANAKVSGQGRIEGLLKGIELLGKYPISGCGPGVWRKATGSNIESHNLYGQLMGELGGVGIVAFAIMVGLFIAALVKFRRRCRPLESSEGQFLFQLTGALGMALVLLFLEGNFGHNLLRFTWLWYIGFLVIAMRAARTMQRTAPMAMYPRQFHLGPVPQLAS
jgi:O-antigen ligase